MLRQGGASQSAVMIRLLEVLGGIAAVEDDPARRAVLTHHADMARTAALRGTRDAAARRAIRQRHAAIG